MLYTNLKHIEYASELSEITNKYENILLICGRMDPFSIPVLKLAESLRKEYRHIEFFDFEFDNPESNHLKNHPELQGFSEMPFIVFYKNGKVAGATSGILSRQQLKTLLDTYFQISVNV